MQGRLLLLGAIYDLIILLFSSYFVNIAVLHQMVQISQIIFVSVKIEFFGPNYKLYLLNHYLRSEKN